MYTSFVEQRKNFDRSTLYSFKGPFELLHADTIDIRFLSKSAVDPRYCLLFVDLFTSKIYTGPMKKKTLLKKYRNFLQRYLKNNDDKMRKQIKNFNRVILEN